jgi:thioredoxin-disulfide reductase
MQDTIIIGAGPAGLTAAIYAARKKLKTLVLSKDLGGQLARASEIENYPGLGSIPGLDLIKRFEAQAKAFGAEIEYQDVVAIKEKGKLFEVHTTSRKHECKTLILALGKTPRDLNILGENKFKGKGVSYCPTCDAPLFKNKIVAVVGGGNSAFDAVQLLSRFARKVYLVHRRNEFRGDETGVDKIKKLENVELILSSSPTEIKGDKFVKSLVISNVETGKRKELQLDGIFVEFGWLANPGLVKHLVRLDKNNQILINDRCETSHRGIFAAGDITTTPYKQVVIAAGEGAKAALSAYGFLKNS